MGRKKKQKSTGQLDVAIGKGPDAEYTAWQDQKRTNLAQQVAAQKQAKEQDKKRKQEEAKKAAQNRVSYKLTHNPLTDIAGGLAKGAANTGKAAVGITKTAIGQATKNPKAADNAAKATQEAYDQSLAKGLYEGTLKPLKDRAASQIKHLSSPTSTEDQRKQVVANQKAAAQNPEYIAATKNVKSGTVSGTTKAQKQAAQGKKAPEIEKTLKEESKKSDANIKKAAGTAASIGSLIVGGGSLKSLTARQALKKTAPTAAAGAAGAVGGEVAKNPDIEKKELVKAGATGLVAGAALPLGAHGLGKTAKAGVDKARREKPAAEAPTPSGQLKPLMAERTKLESLKSQYPNQPQIDETIGKVDMKIAEIQRGDEKIATDSAKVTEKNSSELKKIDQQSELIKAKKADGKFTNVDKIKLKQLEEKKTELEPAISSSSGSIAPELHPAYQKLENLKNDIQGKHGVFGKVADYVDDPAIKKLIPKDMELISSPNIKTEAEIRILNGKPVANAIYLHPDKIKNTSALELNQIIAHEVVHHERARLGRSFDGHIEEHSANGSSDYFGLKSNIDKRLAQPTQVAKKPEVAPELRAIREAQPDPKLQSKVYKRLKNEHPDLKDDVSYDAIQLKKDSEKAVELLAKDKNKAYRVAMGAEDLPDQTSTGVNIAMAEKALDEGNHQLYAQLVKKRSLDQTRRGQEIVAEKTSISDNSTSRYVKELISTRMEKAGKRYLSDISQDLKKTPVRERTTRAIDRDVSVAQRRIKNKDIDLAEAQSLIDRLVCK